MPRTSVLTIALALALAGAALCAGEYEVGGPLAGVKLPLMKTQHGEKPGYPGALPGKFGTEGLAPVLELWPGSVELYHTYMDKYLPIRSLFDRQSQLKRWTAPGLPVGGKARAEQYAAPLYFVARHGGAGTKPSGKFWWPAPVVRCTAKSPVVTLDLGTLDIGLYAVRVIGAVETKALRHFRRPLFIAMRVNDGPGGEINTYRLRCGYVDEFYSVAEFYFHAVAKRRFKAELFVDEGSRVELLVNTITLDNVLAGTTDRALKKGMTLHTPESIAASNSWANRAHFKRVRYTGRARLERDRAIWRAMPPINAQGTGGMGMPKGVSYGTADKTAKEIEEEFGAWRPIRHGIIGPVSGANYTHNPKEYNTFLVNAKLGLTYTVDDLWAREPLPDPYPCKDSGAGLYFPDPTDPTKGRLWAPIAREVRMRYIRYYCLASKGGIIWQSVKGEDWARDGAVALVRYAYQFPTMDSSNMLSWLVSARGPAYAGDPRCRKRITKTHWQGYQSYMAPVMAYDMLFDYIKDNQDLAVSIGRFVPWVRTSEDVIRLLDVYLVQHTARQLLRYRVHTGNFNIARVAAVLGDPEVTDPWMEFAMAGLYIYPSKPAGVQDLMISNTCRNGAMTIGSTSYAYQGSIPFTRTMDEYRAVAGGAPQFDLNRFSSKPRDHVRWSLSNVIAGHDFARIGDVCGPDKPPGKTLGRLAGVAGDGWRWTKQARYAWILKHVRGRKTESDEEWTAIEEAAATVKRAPWLDLRSRVLPNWFATLESGLAHDDPRFRRAVYVRTGVGIGHVHYDALDLQFVAHGLPMTVDGGQRSGYSKPNDRYTRIHNLVEVCGGDLRGYGHPLRYCWTSTLTDAEGARFMHVAAVPPPYAAHYSRQVALIDVSEPPAHSLPVAGQMPGAALAKGVTTPNSYIVDVFRVAGGKLHSYNFHGPVSDRFESNVTQTTTVKHIRPSRATDSDEAYLAPFEFAPKSKFAGSAPETLVATWRYSRSPGEKGRGTGNEMRMAKKNFDPESPRKFTRLHLLGAKGLRVLEADVVCYKNPIQYRLKQLMAQRRGVKGKRLESAFVAVIEPYADRPFITSTRLLPIAGNDTDALRAVALEVKTTNGRTDVCFVNGQPEKTRKMDGMTVSGEFAYVSADARGLRLATLTGGKTLEAPAVRIKTESRERTGKIVKVGYAAKTLWVDTAWPETSTPSVVEIIAPGRRTTYTVTEAKRDGDLTRMKLLGAAEAYRSRIARVVPADGRVDCALDFMNAMGGATKGWTASNEAQTHFWRADHLGGNDFKLAGGAVSEKAFAPDGVLRLWEYGVGDTVRRSTFVSVRRTADGAHEIDADVDCTVTLGGKTFQFKAGRFGPGPVNVNAN